MYRICYRDWFECSAQVSKSMLQLWKVCNKFPAGLRPPACVRQPWQPGSQSCLDLLVRTVMGTPKVAFFVLPKLWFLFVVVFVAAYSASHGNRQGGFNCLPCCCWWRWWRYRWWRWCCRAAMKERTLMLRSSGSKVKLNWNRKTNKR